MGLISRNNEKAYLPGSATAPPQGLLFLLLLLYSKKSGIIFKTNLRLVL